MMADEQKEMQSMAKGNIAVAVGMKNVGTTSAISSTVIYLPSPPPTHTHTHTADVHWGHHSPVLYSCCLGQCRQHLSEFRSAGLTSSCLLL